MIKKTIILFLLALYINSANSQILSEEDSLSLINKASFYHKNSISKFKDNNFEDALKYALMEFEIFTSLKIKNKNFNNCIYNIAFFNEKSGNYKESIKYYTNYLSLDSVERKNNVLKNLAKVYFKNNEFNKSKTYYKKAILQYQTVNNFKGLFYSYISLVKAYRVIDSELYKNEILELFNKIKILKSKFHFTLNNNYVLNNQLAMHYLDNYNFNNAKKYYLNNLKLALSNKDSIVSAAMYINLGELYTREKKDSAVFFLKKALEYDKLLKDKFESNLSFYYYKKNKYLKALEHINLAIDYNLNFNNKTEDFIPSYNDITKSKDIFFLIDNYHSKINIYLKLYKKNKNSLLLNNALININIFEKIVDVIKKEHSESISNLFWQEKVSPIYFKGVYCSNILGDLKLASYYIEKNKALLLLNNTILKNLKSKLPKEVIDIEYTYKKRINTLKELVSNNNLNKDSLQSVLFIAYQNFNKLKDSLKNLYPKIYYSNDTSLLSLEEIQNKLDSNEVVLSFILNKDELLNNTGYELIITNKNAFIVSIADATKFYIDIENYKKLLVKPLTTERELNLFNNISFNLYKNFFPTTKIQKIIKNKKILIIPDGEIQNIPFEALITKENTSDYLINHSEISYSYSMSFLDKNNNFKRNPINNFIGFSPVSFDTLNLTSLKYSQLEVKSINNIFNGETFLDTEATKKHFLNECENYNIIHLATHSDASSTTNPWVAFKNKKLNLEELYITNTQADLVVLSACNTSLGKISKGEGVLSLARGFFYSGSKTVVSSLWNINDKSSADLMINFYKNLKNGQSKSLALTKVKRMYLKNHTLTESSPYYWASFILIGDSGELHQLSSDNYWYYYVILDVLLLLVIVWIIKKTLRN